MPEPVTTNADDQPPTAAPEAWRDVSVDELIGYGVSQSVVDKLKEAECATLGAIATFTQTKLLTEIEGIGEKKAESIQDALECYWGDHPVEAEEEVPPAEEDDDDGEN